MRTTLSAVSVLLCSASTSYAVFVPPGLSVGDEYQLLFVTEGRRSASTVLLSVYTNFVQTEAARNPTLTGTDEGVDWFPVVSVQPTSIQFSNARDNAPVGASTPVYLLDGTLFATGASEFYGGSIRPAFPNVDQFLDTYTGMVFTGSLADGTVAPGRGLSQSSVQHGITNTTSAAWLSVGTTSELAGLPFYALSSPITVEIPEPTSALLVASTLVCGGLGRRRRF